jgi:hypothetical protein
MQYTGLIIMYMVSVSSKTVANHIYKMAKSVGIDVERQHYQVIENRIEPTEDDKIYIQRVDPNTEDNKLGSAHSSNSEGRIYNLEYQVYQQEVPDNGYSGRFVYCIGVDDTKDDIKTACILMLNQATTEEKLNSRTIFNYDASIFYINLPLQEITMGQSEESSDTEFKKHIMRATTEWNSFQDFVNMVSFNSGRLWEMPIQFTGHEMVHLSIHEPLSKPSVLNIVLQKYDGISVSYMLCIDLISD